MSSFSLTNLRLWDGKSSTYSDQDVVSVKNGRIDGFELNGGISRDCSGLTAMPGLIDAHVHMTLDPSIKDLAEQLAQSDADIWQKMLARSLAMVEAGITTARDLGGGAWLELKLRDEINAGKIAGPRLLCAGQPVTSIDGHCHFWGGASENADDAKGVINRNRSHGVDLIKVMATGGMYTKASHPGRAQFSQPCLDAIVEYAHSLEYSVAAHCHGTEGIERAVHSGVNTVEHCSWMDRNAKRTDFRLAVAESMAANNTWVSPTINSGWKRFMTKDEKFLKHIQDQFAKMKEAGVRLIASTDAGIPNVKHDDLPVALPIFAKFAALSPLDALRTATSLSAKALNIHTETGTIEVGKSADLVLVEGDPLEDLSVLTNPALIVIRGQVIEPRR